MEEEFKSIELEERWNQHFELLNKNSRKHSYDIADSTENKPFNRYIDVLPYDRSLIKLTRAGLPSKYINANIVTVPKAARQYILTQGPLPETVESFWAMVWEQNSTVIVMLNQGVELKNFVKCERYWPSQPGLINTYANTSLSVKYLSVDETKHYTIRHLLLEDQLSKKTREITQFQYKVWPDYGQPESPTSFLRLLTAIRKSGGLDRMNQPALVHCSAGIGRSGTFCLIDSVLSMAENQGSTEAIDILNTLIEMRDYRMGLIQSPMQLRFAYMCIIYGIKILESSNKLHPHMSSMTAIDKAAQSTTNGTSLQSNGRKSRRRKGQQIRNGPDNSTTLNVFNRHLMVEAMDDIDSDDADKLFEESTKQLPNLKKARNSEPENFNLLEKLKQLTKDSIAQHAQDNENEQQISAATKAQLLTNAINNLLAESKISQNADLSPNSSVNQNTDSVLLRRRERELRNQRLAEKTQDIKNRMKAEELRKERRAAKMALLKKSAFVGGVAILVGSIAYMYLNGH